VVRGFSPAVGPPGLPGVEGVFYGFCAEKQTGTPSDDARRCESTPARCWTKTFTEDIEGEGQVEYLTMYRNDGSATFVGLERPKGVESVGSCWNSTTVFQRRDHVRKSIHSHWSFTRHAAFQSMTPEASEGLV